MKEKGKFRSWIAGSDRIHYLRFAVFPLAAVLLIAVIMSADRGQEETVSGETVIAETPAGGERLAREEAPEDGAASGAEEAAGAGETSGAVESPNGGVAEIQGAGEGEEKTTEDAQAAAGDTAGAVAVETAEDTAGAAAAKYADIDISQYVLKKDEVPELTAIVRTYCQAKEDCDPELLARLYGKSGLSEEELAAEKERMELVKASVKRYENIACYSIDGPEPESYVMFPYFEIQYRGAEFVMPQLTWAYATKTEDGSYIMNETVDEDVAAYIARIGKKEDVAALRSQVEAAAAAAVASDEKLRSVYSGESEVVVGSES